MTTPTLADVKQYWSTHVNDIEVIQAPVGSAEFLSEIEAYRYEKMPYLRPIATSPTFRGKRVLEIGCGPGVDSVQIATAGAKLTAVDLTPQAVALTRQHLSVRGLEGTVQEANAEQLPFPDGSFDIVYSHGVLHHTVNTQKAIDEVRRVLAPGGRAIIMLYHSRSWFWWLSKVSRTPVEHADADAPIVRAYSVDEVRQLFRAFTRVEVTTERFPVATRKFKGLKGWAFNRVFVPVFNLLPAAITRGLGWHLMIWAEK
ncbi:MAG: class I SAM-dependent methyltransferase [Vicinamibacterales bacterium]